MTTNSTIQAACASHKPTHVAYQVKEGKDGKSLWQRIGAAWLHKDGQGLSLQLDSLPVNGRVELRPNQPKTKHS